MSEVGPQRDPRTSIGGDAWIRIDGAREHNLRNISVAIPRGRLTVITGLSGSGKSSLAFDTLYAEGQRRYVESLSTYARQFMDQLQKPDVDHISGLSPAVAIEQRLPPPNPRSIVATSTEIHDYLRLLFAYAGTLRCPACGGAVERQTAEQIVAKLIERPPRTRLVLLAPLVRDAKGDHSGLLDSVSKQGFVRVRLDGEIVDLENLAAPAPRKPHTIEAVIDRLVITSRISSRLTDSVELALRQGNGVMIALEEGEGGAWTETRFSERLSCAACDLVFEDITPRTFSFNSPQGACPSCGGLGERLVIDADLVVPDPGVSLDDGAIRPWRRGSRRLIIHYKQLLRGAAKHCGVDMETPFRDLPKEARRVILHGSGGEDVEYGGWSKGVARRYRKAFEGVIPNLLRRHRETESEFVRSWIESFMNPTPCETCGGTRLRPEARSCRVGGASITEACALQVGAARKFFAALELPAGVAAATAEVLSEIRRRLDCLGDMGLDYITLDRRTDSLSGGEVQRMRLAAQIGSGLTGVLYVLDEPTVGLHARDGERLIAMLKSLRDMGNTVVVVEHDEAMIRQADYLVDLGPGAGPRGGEVLFAGPPAELRGCARSLTARHLFDASRGHPPQERRPPGGDWLRILGAAENNLKNIDVEIPLGLFVCVTGVSGSGKSTLVDEILRKALFRHFHGSKERPGRHRAIEGMDKIDGVVLVDQSPIGRTPRSNPATYTGAFAVIRSLFAQTPASRVRGFGPGRFSFNVKGGRCETCKGDGLIRLEMHFLPDVYVTCQQCRGRRYNPETLGVYFGGKNIAEVLEMTIGEAAEFFRNIPAVERKLTTMGEVGLDYLRLGQSATTLSGGEAQRIKLSAELSRTAPGRLLYLLDEPTTGLHFADIQRLMVILHRLRDAGHTVVVIEHNMDVIAASDYIIDLGPEGGDGGGRLVAAGPPETVAGVPSSFTGGVLRPYVTGIDR